MTPTLEQVVAACQRAGIPAVFFDEKSREIRHLPPPEDIYFKVDPAGGFVITPEDDSCPGAALFIVAVLSALRKVRMVKVFSAPNSRWACTMDMPGDEEHVDDWACITDTLIAACMAAIVAAYPPKEDK